jgi:hypothetical protein
VFIAPELVNGAPVRIIVEPNAAGSINAHLLVNAYDAERNPFQRWEREGLLRYFDQQKAPSISGTFQPRLTGLPGNKRRGKILTQKHLAGYRRANDPQRSSAPQPSTTGATVATITDAIRKAYGNVLDKLQAKGLVTLVQSQDDAIEAAAKARADKTGQPLEVVLEELLASVSKSSAMRLWVGSRTVNDALVPETTEYAGSKTGNLASVPAGAKVPVGPIRVAVGQAFGPHRGFGMEHMHDNMQRDARRAPVAETGDAAEDLMRQAVAVLRGATRIHNDGNAYVFVNLVARQAAIAQWRGDHYSVVSVRPYQGDSVALWGNPEWAGRLTFPTRDAAAAPPSTTDTKANELRQGRTGLEVQSERFDLNAEGAKPQPTVTIKKRRNLDIKRSADGAIQGFYDPQSGQSFMIADGLTNEAAPGVLVHEVGIHMAADTSSDKGNAAFDKIVERAGQLLELGRGNVFFDRVNQRMRDAGETSNDEAAAYIAEEYERDRVNAPASVKRWVTDFLAAVRGWLFGKGVLVKASDLGAADIAAIARANVRQAARGTIDPRADTTADVKGSKDAAGNFYGDLRRRVADGRGYREDELFQALAGGDKGASRSGFIHYRGGMAAIESATATAYWDGELAGAEGFFTTAFQLKQGGKPALRIGNSTA